MSIIKFNDFELSSELFKALNLLGYNKPTLVQEKVIPAILEKKDIIVKSQTGSGKTAAFAIPICESIEWEDNEPQAMVLTPTRELAIQVKEEIFNIGRFKRLKVSALYGKSPIKSQIKELKQKTHVIVGTPGRIIDHIDRGTLNTSNISFLVIDEADEMLNMGFLEQIESIIKTISKNRTTTLLSATMPNDIISLANKYMNDSIYIEIEEINAVSERIIQERYEINQKDKSKILDDILIVENPDSCIVFCNTKLKVDEIYSLLSSKKYSCDKIHGGMEQDERIKTMNNFKQGYFRYLIATDVAARGIDIDDISLVINYDIPHDKEIYTHRIGRTGRKNNNGKAISFVTSQDQKYFNEIMRFTEIDILLKERPDIEKIEKAKFEFLDKSNATLDIKEVKGTELNKEILKLHINAGKKTKMRPVDIVGTLCNIEGVSVSDIGIISIVDVSTFVEILNNKGEYVLEALKETPIKGRMRKVSKADI